jgi:ubiquinone biosynthesis protein UbiJ
MISLFLNAANNSINKTLSLDPQNKILLSIISQKSIKIILIDLDLSFYIHANNDRIILSEQNMTQNSLCILEGKYNNFLKMILSNNPQSFIRNQTIIQKGELNILRSYESFFKSTKFDIESIIEKMVGVNPTSIFLFPIKKLNSLLHYKAKYITKSTHDFLIEETQYLVGAEEIIDYFDDICSLKSDFDRVNTKVNICQDYVKKLPHEKKK